MKTKSEIEEVISQKINKLIVDCKESAEQIEKAKDSSSFNWYYNILRTVQYELSEMCNLSKRSNFSTMILCVKRVVEFHIENYKKVLAVGEDIQWQTKISNLRQVQIELINVEEGMDLKDAICKAMCVFIIECKELAEDITKTKDSSMFDEYYIELKIIHRYLGEMNLRHTTYVHRIKYVQRLVKHFLNNNQKVLANGKEIPWQIKVLRLREIQRELQDVVDDL